MSKVPSPFNAPKHSERTANQTYVEWINRLFSEMGNGYYAKQETILADQKSPDIVLYDGSQKPFCVIELKSPAWDILTDDLVRKTYYEASKLNAPYFATCNMNKLVLFDTDKYGRGISAKKSIYDSVIHPYEIVYLLKFEDIDIIENKIRIQNFLKKFLDELYLLYTKQKTAPRTAIDEYFIAHLHTTIDSISISYKDAIQKKAESNVKFKEHIASWFSEQMWSFYGDSENYERIARQAAYLMINKILFYHALSEKYGLEPLAIPESLRSGSRLQNELQWFFNEILKIDYETIFTANFIDNISFPEDEKAIQSVKDLIVELNRHKMSQIGYDVIGQIFEKMIPESERHKLGQYFTSADVVDFILSFCLKKESDFMMDPSCGAGTFLVRAYQRKKILMNFRMSHASLLETLWGIDISKFAAHLSTINLAIKDLREDENYPRILHSDFFKISPEKIGFKVPKSIVKGLGAKEKEFVQPKKFDAIVGNPPYTRQEEMEDLSHEGYKSDMIETALTLGGSKMADISRRAGIHAYFFVHGTKFLADGGRFGFIVSNSWLDVDYGKGLQEFFLKNYRITAVIESKIERWFTDADINTCIVLLERCASAKERDGNYVKFVQLKKKLSEFIPASNGDFESERKRLEAVDDLVKSILPHREYYENADMRIYPKLQSELFAEGYDKEEKTYVGSKWGKYVRAPEIFFKILEKGKKVFVPLKDVADVRFGIKTGANEFFYLTEDEIKTRAIEKEFWMHKEDGKWIPNYVIKSPKECKSIIVKPEDLKYRVLMIHKDKKDLKGTNVLKYIEWGEREGYHKRPTCASRKRWYDFGEISAPILSKRFIDKEFSFIANRSNVFIGDTFFVITPIVKEKTELISSFLNSTMGAFFCELFGRTLMGEGVLLIYGPEIRSLPAISSIHLTKSQAQKLEKFFDKLSSREISSVFEELGANSPEEVSLDKVKPDRRELDKIVMGEILGLSEKEQLEVYRAVIDLVKSRIDKAKSVPRKKKSRLPDEKVLVQGVLRFVDVARLGKFPDDYIGRVETEKMDVPEGAPESGTDLKGAFVKISGERISCPSRAVAEYIKYAVLSGKTKIKVPKDEAVAKKAVEEYRKIYHEVEGEVNLYLAKFVSDRKVREKIKRRVWLEATKKE